MLLCLLTGCSDNSTDETSDTGHEKPLQAELDYQDEYAVLYQASGESRREYYRDFELRAKENPKGEGVFFGVLMSLTINPFLLCTLWLRIRCSVWEIMTTMLQFNVCAKSNIY